MGHDSSGERQSSERQQSTQLPCKQRARQLMSVDGFHRGELLDIQCCWDLRQPFFTSTWGRKVKKVRNRRGDGFPWGSGWSGIWGPSWSVRHWPISCRIVHIVRMQSSCWTYATFSRAKCVSDLSERDRSGSLNTFHFLSSLPAEILFILRKIFAAHSFGQFVGAD